MYKIDTKLGHNCGVEITGALTAFNCGRHVELRPQSSLLDCLDISLCTLSDALRHT